MFLVGKPWSTVGLSGVGWWTVDVGPVPNWLPGTVNGGLSMFIHVLHCLCTVWHESAAAPNDLADVGQVYFPSVDQAVKRGMSAIINSL